jgi:sterol desaturase/sphingolipid hydroxylase (fatty acid hydroxylase superfamily)
MNSNLLWRVVVLSIVAAFIVLELAVSSRAHRRCYSWPESMASLGVAIGHRLTSVLTGGILSHVFFTVWHYRLLTVPLDRWWGILLLFLGLEFFYYWQHRAAHRVRWLWATHAVHHSAEYFNLSAAYRLGWTGLLSGNFLFFLPLCWLGFHPGAVLLGVAAGLLYQFWLHTELIPPLGCLEWLLNTPSHHRVHHASNQPYLDRNYGGVLIIFDRLFGTLEREQTHNPPRYGLTQPLRSHNPITIALHEWLNLLKDIRRAPSWRDRFKYAVAPPDWQRTED